MALGALAALAQNSVYGEVLRLDHTLRNENIVLRVG
jgi:hypothetical protein